MPRSNRLIVLLSTLIAWTFCVAPAQAGSWIEGPTFGTGGYSLLDAVTVDSAGNSTFAWTQASKEPGSYIQRRTADGQLGPKEKLPNGGYVDMESTGSGTVLSWYEADSVDPEVPGGKVKLRWLDATGSPTTTITVATVGTRVAIPTSLAVTPGGDAAVAWAEYPENGDDPASLHFRRITAGGQLGPKLDLGPVHVSTGPFYPTGASLSMTPDGRSYLAWLTMETDPDDPSSEGSTTAHVARFGPSGQPDGSAELPQGDKMPADVQLSSSSGGVVATWRLLDEGQESMGSTLMAANLSATGSIAGNPQYISGEVPYLGPMVAVDVSADGTATIAYARSLSTFDSTLYVRRFQKDGSLGSESRLSGDLGSNQGAMTPMLAPDQDGSLVATWMLVSATATIPTTSFASRAIAADGTLAATTRVIPGGDYSFMANAKVVGNGKGDITMAWARYVRMPDLTLPSPTDDIRIHSSFHDSRPPQVVASIPKKLKRGENGRMSVTATSKSGIADVEWDFGDGSLAKGASVQHVYGRAGDYDLTVKVTDNGGDSTVVSRKINVYEPGANRAPARLKLTKAARKKGVVKIQGKIDPRAGGKVYITWRQKTARKTVTLKSWTKITKGRFKATVRLSGTLAKSKAPGKLKVAYGGNKKTKPARVSRVVRA